MPVLSYLYENLRYQKLHELLQRRAGEDRPEARIAIFTFSARTTATPSAQRAVLRCLRTQSLTRTGTWRKPWEIERTVIVNPTPYARITNARSIRSKYLAESERRE